MRSNMVRSLLKIGTLIAHLNSDVDGYIELASNDVAKSTGRLSKDCRDYLLRNVA